MKIKKIIAAALSVITVCSVSVPTLSGCKTCEHLYDWTIDKPADCTNTGLRTGKCETCNDIKTEVIPIDVGNHSYGNWEVTKPSAENVGKAVKICANNSGHKHEITLPALTSDFSGYKMTVKKWPTQIEDGERELTFADESGDVVFSVPFTAVGVETVEDAVAVASVNRSLVRSCYGKYTSNRLDGRYDQFFYEFGDEYCHIIDSGDNERSELWYTKNGNGVYAVRARNKKYSYDEQGLPAEVIQQSTEILQDTDPDEEYLQGFPFNFYYVSAQGRYFGAENALAGIYAVAKTNPNKDFKEEVKTENGQKVYTFSFSCPNEPNYFSCVNVSFTLTEENAIKQLVVETKVFDNRGDNPKWQKDEKTGIYSAIDPDSPSGIEYAEYNQILISELSEAERENVPVSPYNAESFKIKSFDVERVSGWDFIPVDDDTVITVEAGRVTRLRLVNPVNNIEGVNDLSFDPVEVYLRTDSGDVRLSSLSSNQTVGHFQLNPEDLEYSNAVTLLFRKAYINKIVLKTRSGSFEKVITYNVTPKVPTALTPEICLFGATDYYWTEDNKAEIYVGEPLKFRAGILEKSEEEYSDKSFTTNITSSNAANAQIVHDEEGFEATFTASAEGVYTFEMFPEKNTGAIPVVFTITVRRAPTGAELFGNVNYIGQSSYPKGRVNVSCTWSGNSGKITVTVSDGKAETLNISLNGKVLTSSHSGGEELGFTASLDEGYRLVLTHPTGFDDGTERIVLIKAED